MTTLQQTKDQLNTERKELIAKLDTGNPKDILKLLKENEKKGKDLARIELLAQTNNKYARLRTLAAQAYECEQPTEDITTNDGSFHKVKVKKYPNLAALQYASAKWEDNKITRITINGEKFTMFQQKHEYQKETVYTRPETFEAFLDLNSIPQADITIEQYNEIGEKLALLNEQLKKDIAKYEQGLKDLNYSSLNYWGLIGQHDMHLYEYTPNK